MLEAYRSYKSWWVEWQAPSRVGSLYWGDTPEDAFQQHLKEMSTYEFFELLSVWEVD